MGSIEALRSSPTTMKTDLINETSQSFQLKEGNAGAFRLLDQLNAKSKFPIKVDPNATYREYMVATGKKGESIILTSDDFMEYKVIKIIEVPGTPVTYTSELSVPRESGLSRASQPASAGVQSPHGVQSKAGGESGAGVESDPPASSSAGMQSAPPGPPVPGGESTPPSSSSAGVQSAPPGPSVPPSAPPGPSGTGGEPALGISNQNGRRPWYRKLKLFK